MIVNVPLNAIGEESGREKERERPHVPHPGLAYNQGSYIACARGAKFNFVLFVHAKSSSLPVQPPASVRASARARARSLTRHLRVLPVFIATKPRSEGTDDAGVEEISARFHGASGWHSAEATWWLPRRLTRVYSASIRDSRMPRDHFVSFLGPPSGCVT